MQQQKNKGWVNSFQDEERKKILELSKSSLFKSEGKKALKYLTDVRKFSIKAIKDYEIGFCPETAPHQLRGRLITPIYNYNYKLIALSTRCLDINKNNRFWHEKFTKRFYLYGLNISKEYIIKYNKVVITEGEFDAISLYSFGFKNNVSLCSKSLTLSQIGTLSRYTTNFIFLLDSDTAGFKGIAKINEIWDEFYLKERGINKFIATLPAGDDPNDFLKKNSKEELQKILIESQKE